jgi:hypothetical protein
MAATERLFFRPRKLTSTHPMTPTTFPPAAAAVPFKADSFRPLADTELQRRRAMPPAFYQHLPPALVRPDLLTSKPRLISASKA